MREVALRNRWELGFRTTRTSLCSLVLLAVLAQGGCTDSSSSAANSLEWERYRPIAEFSFAGPADLEPIDAQPVDSAAGVYRSPSLEVTYDYGWFADTLEDAAGEARSREHRR